MNEARFLELANLIGGLQENLKQQIQINSNLIQRIQILELQVNQLIMNSINERTLQNGD
jgi:hypothetical protein